MLPTHIQQELIEVHNYNLYVLSYPYHIPHGKEGWEITRPKTKFILNDALLFDYSQLPNYFDYLQIDIHPPKNNWLVLEKIIKQKEFAVITFEHDIWDNTPESKQAKVNAYQLLIQLGYTLVADNVTIEPEHTTSTADGPIYFEDWYANPKYIDKSVIDCYKCIGTGWPKYYQQILFQPTVKV